MKTRDELLAMAEELLQAAVDCARTSVHQDAEHAPIATALAATAQACVMLAKELRESENAPTYEQVERLNANVEGLAVWIGRVADKP